MTPLRVPLDGRVTGMPWDEIDTVVFDVGNVLLSFNPEKTLEELFPEDAETRQIMLDTVVRSPCWVMLDRGTLSQEEAVKAMAGLHPELENDIRYVLENWIDLKDVVQEGVDTLKRCKAMGKRCIVLSNYHDESFKHVQRKFDFFRFGFFTVVILTYIAEKINRFVNNCEKSQITVDIHTNNKILFF